MTNAEYRKKRLERKNRHRADRNILFYGMGVRVLNSAPDTIRHKRVRSAKKFIKLCDKPTVLTIIHESYSYSGYGARRVECVYRGVPTLLERYGERLCWK